ncbi:MAG TPA: metalloregulator ArsR/SmtB family transcription factor [Acidimicrobiales bacterium]|nr:metalloregulator ArsR/SmtB family transcription factor [Acidimicrobiales bacterium]
MSEHHRLDELLPALADPVRRRAVAALATGARRAGELAAATGVSPAAMSRHLRILLAAGLVDDERSVADARVRLFFLRREPLEELSAWLGAVVAGEPWPAEE